MIRLIPGLHTNSVRAPDNTAVIVDCLDTQGFRTVAKGIILVLPDDRPPDSRYLGVQCVIDENIQAIGTIGIKYFRSVPRNLILCSIVVNRFPVSHKRDVFESKVPNIRVSAHRIRGTHRDGTCGPGVFKKA